MYKMIVPLFVEIFKFLIPFLGQKINEPNTATDAPYLPKHIRDAWLRGS